MKRLVYVLKTLFVLGSYTTTNKHLIVNSIIVVIKTELGEGNIALCRTKSFSVYFIPVKSQTGRINMT